MGNVSPNFNRKEFACHCGCGFAAVDVKLLKILENIREHFGAPVVVSSGCRCVEHNRKIGGAGDSMHTKGMAADIRVDDVSPLLVARYLENNYHNQLGIGIYDTWVHIDVRGYRVRWGYGV